MGHPMYQFIYTVPNNDRIMSHEQIEWTKLNQKVLYHFAQ